jgi:protein-S-isoprenylcysteine O-methyltransferase Ste14/Co/Zn/Cd efflux system component
VAHTSEIGESWGIAITLLEKPLTVEGIQEQFYAFSRRFGFFGNIISESMHKRVSFTNWLDDRLTGLMKRGWIVRDGRTYALTDRGREAANKALLQVERAQGHMDNLATPENASKLTLIVHLFLAVLKLPAGIISGSVGLLNDAIDTLVDGVASLMVYWGLRVKRERLVSRLLVLFMLATGGFAFIEAVLRIIRREPVEADWFAFIAVLISALVCAVLWFIQRFIGLRRQSMALITQSVDSRNHVIVAGGVTAGLIAGLLRFPWLDYLVGVVVAVLILKSAVELAVELIRSRNEETPDLGKFQFGVYERFRRSQLRSYMLFLVRNQEAVTRGDLLNRVHTAFDFQGNVFLRSMRAERLAGSEELIQSCYRDLIEKKLLVEEGNGQTRLELTPAGEKRLASNRFFLQEGQTAGFKIGVGSALRIGFSLVVRWTLFIALYWLAVTQLIPRLPGLPLWNSIDFTVLSAWNLSFSLFEIIHLFLGFVLVTHAAVRMSLIYQRHLSLRSRRSRKYTTLQTDGFYARVRHPMAANRLLYALGLCVALPTVWALVPFAVALLASILSGIIEERRELGKRFGAQYRVYKQEVPRRYLTPWLAVYLGIAAAAFSAGMIL